MGGRNRITDMAFLRKRASGNYALSWKWKGKSYIKGLGTKDLAEAERIKQDAQDQRARIRSGESALASKLLADGHSIVDVLFGSEEIGHLIASPTDDNPLTLSQLKAAFVDALEATGRTPGHIEGTRGHLDLRMLPVDPKDGVTVCPECGCAWRLEGDAE